MDIDWDTIEHFRREEFACPCCQRATMSRDFVRMLDNIREDLGRPIYVTAGFRCRKQADADPAT